MSYGNYNPGWRCQDNTTSSSSSLNSLDNNVSYSYSFSNVSVPTSSDAATQPSLELEYRRDLSCEDFETCGRVQFNPESLTIVTEWNLMCNRAWIASFMISAQMAGNLLASFISGHLTDSIGRKKTMYGSLIVTAILNGVSAFSSHWQIFVGFRFAIGVTSAFFESLNYVYPAEFMTTKWRGPLAGIPGWSIAGVLFGLTAMLLKNWRHLLIVTSGLCFVSFIPVIWAPESLRWLEVKNKKNEFEAVAKKMMKMNKKRPRKEADENDLSMHQLSTPDTITTDNDKTKYTMLDLFRPGYRIRSITVGFVWASLSFIFYGIGFGIRALSGDFYINLILVYIILMAFAACPLFAPNLLGRKKSSCLFISISAGCLISATCFELFTGGNVRLITTLVLVFVAEVGTDTTWVILQVMTSELYPTVVRGLAMNWGSLMARIGGILSPFIIPKDTESVYVWYLVMACLGFVCCLLLTRVPETRGKPLEETFDERLEVIVSEETENLEENCPS